jgi:hypothetical protein
MEFAQGAYAIVIQVFQAMTALRLFVWLLNIIYRRIIHVVQLALLGPTKTNTAKHAFLVKVLVISA